MNRMNRSSVESVVRACTRAVALLLELNVLPVLYHTANHRSRTVASAAGHT
jgi:hypothetical protein